MVQVWPHRLFRMFRQNAKRWSVAGLIYLVAVSILWHPVLICGPWTSSAHAQTSDLNLPRLGDVENDEFSPASERRVGQAILQNLMRAGVVLEDAELTQWINDFAAPLTRTRQAQGYSFTLFLIRDRSINAFAMPGGYIGVHTGLIEAAASEAELATVLGHEIGHVTQRHLARQFSKQNQSVPILVASTLLAILAAKNNPNAAVGLLQLGEATAMSNLLRFSRDAEREADRVGLEILSEAGFNPLASVSFFNKLQSANRVYDGNAPDYLRSHPLTSERISDMQLRTLSMKAKIRPDSLEFDLVKARLRAQADGTREGAQSGLTYFQSQLSTQPKAGQAQEIAVNWYGQAIAQSQLLDFPKASQALDRAAAVLPPRHSMILRERIRLASQSKTIPQLLELTASARKEYPNKREFMLARVEALMQAALWSEATLEVEGLLQERRSDAELWRLASEIYANTNQPPYAHRAAGERLALQASWKPAIEQMMTAQRTIKGDFILAAIVDAKIKEFKQEFEREKNDPMFAKR
jgi:beta-barrel assembly-enhancing protease